MAPAIFSLTVQIVCLTLFSLSLLCTAFTPHDYSDALEKSILFFEGQRSGRLPTNQRLKWRGNSGLSDGSSYHVCTTTVPNSLTVRVSVNILIHLVAFLVWDSGGPRGWLL